MTKVTHIRTGQHTIYIGRPRSGEPWRFGNPFVVGRDGVRGECISKFKLWLETGSSQGCIDATPARRDWILTNLHTLKNQTLGCFCSPAPCHGNVLAELADQTKTA